MRHTTGPVACIVAVAALVVGGASASAATTTAKGTPPAKVTQLIKLSRVDGQFISLVRRVRPCPGSAGQIRAAGKLRATALKRARRSPVRVLRRKNVVLSRAVLRLARFAGTCRAGTTTTPVLVRPRTPAGPSGGASSASLTLPMALGSAPVDVSSLLDGRSLPEIIAAVPIENLTAAPCSTPGAACVGIDTGRLGAELTELVRRAPTVGPIAAPLLGQVLEALRTGDLRSIAEVRRVNDRVIELVPRGSLATLRQLLGTTIDTVDGQIGRIQIVP